jgi:short subunit dehydrogenase-like uncharacterized protein
MTEQNQPSGRVVLFGATGYTGELAARAMAKRGMRPVLAGRRREAVEALAAELGELEATTADVADPASVRALVERGDVLVSTVGPFARWGDSALDAALDAGAHYVDSTGEPPFVRKVFEAGGPRAERSGSLLLTAMGYDWVPGNLTGGLALRDAGPAATAVRIGYFTKGGGLGGMSGGTRASAVGALIEPSFAFRDGRIVTERGARSVHEFDFGGRQKPGISVGTSEAFSLPRAFPNVRDVEVYLGWFGGASRPMQAFSLVGAGIAKLPGATALVGAAAERFVKTSTGGPDESARAATGSRFAAEALSASGEVLADVRTEGVNGYTFTGDVLAWAAGRIAAGGSDGDGAMGPVEAFGLDALEAGVAECGISRVG